MRGLMRATAGVLLSLPLLSLDAAAAFRPGFPPEGSAHTHPPTANGRLQERPVVTALRVETGSIRLDGRFDDPVWQRAETAHGFTEAEPERGIPPSEETVFKVAYDEDAIYFAVACYERDPSLTSSTLCRRDRMDNSDLVSVYLDPYHDHTTGYNFRVNPHGSLVDQYVYNDGERDLDWDAVWEAETSRDADGWYAEMRIPFSSIRYRPQEEMTWGLQVYRWMHGRGEDTAWVNWERNVRGFVSRFGELRGLRDLRPPRQLEIVPYVVARSTDPAAEGDEDGFDGFQNLGADIKYGVTADLTLTATVQPDFGQVEADPAVLNLSPFETFFEEKRPFFIEGARFFQHPDFNLFYSRRIGTGDENQRIRFAGKLIGKTKGDVSVAALVAATDVTVDGRAHNFLESGSQRSWYAVGRFGKESGDGNHRINFMQTGVWHDESLRVDEDVDPMRARDAYTSGMDFDLNFADRAYNVRGSFVGTIVDDAPLQSDPDRDHGARYGTGGTLRVSKLGGNLRGELRGSWEHDRLDPNDLGILFAPDEVSSGAWLQHRYNSEDEGRFILQGNTNLNFYRSWLYADRRVLDPADPSRELWSYGTRKPQSTGMNVNGWWETRSRWSAFYGVWHDFEGHTKYQTRSYDGVRGPLLRTLAASGFWWGGNSDWRKPLQVDGELEMSWGRDGDRRWDLEAGVRWVQNSRISHRLHLRYAESHDDAQWVDNLENPGGGIGGVSYVFGELDQRTLDVTLRSSVLFTRNQSLELYVQPFLTTGDYRNARELLTPDSYDLRPYAAADFDVADRDFSFGAVNLNMVYRWEYRPGSTLFLVWTHSRDRYEERGEEADPERFDNRFETDGLFRNEPENTILAKLTWWFSI